jgi:hypothetical protein
MNDQKVTVTILKELPEGYLIKLDDTNSTTIMPKKSFIRRVEAGIYDVSNLNFLTRSI